MRASQNESYEYGYPHSNAFLYFSLRKERSKPQKVARHLPICDVISYFKTISDSIFDVIQSEIAFQNQIHLNVM